MISLETRYVALKTGDDSRYLNYGNGSFKRKLKNFVSGEGRNKNSIGELHSALSASIGSMFDPFHAG